MRILGLLFLLVSNLLIAQNVDLSTFRWRAIGPSFMSGRIVDLAVHPKTNSVYYVGVAAGGVF